MKFISLFAGIGGFDLGLERAGMQCVGQVEYNPFCQRVLKHHWPHVKLVGDIHDVTADSFGTAELICGGFPCQPFSAAGSKKGKSDARYLWPEMLRVIKAYRPTWVIGENVVGIINMALDTVCIDLENEGYSVQPIIIPACGINAPHKRERVWFLAHANSNTDNANGREIREAQGIPSISRSEVGCRLSCGTIGADVPNANGERLQGGTVVGGIGCIWSESEQQPSGQVQSAWENFPTQPPLCGRDDGIPNRVDRIRSLGNAVVPQVVEVIGRAILRAHVLCAERLPDIKEARLTAYNTAMPGGVPPQICEAQTSA